MRFGDIRVVIHTNYSEHQKHHAELMRVGLSRHGISAAIGGFNLPSPCDVAVIWGWRQPKVVEDAPRVLVMERGHLQDRMHYVSCGWGGLQRNAVYPKARDGGARWRRLWGHLMCPVRGLGDRALVLGQINGDAATVGIDLEAWSQQQTDDLSCAGLSVYYRPHPLSVSRGTNYCPAGATLSVGGTLAEDLENAMLAVTCVSTSGVESVLAGVPTVTTHPGAMAWPVAHHSVSEAIKRPRTFDRETWAHDLAWTTWAPDEIASGEAWDHLNR